MFFVDQLVEDYKTAYHEWLSSKNFPKLLKIKIKEVFQVGHLPPLQRSSPQFISTR